VFESPIQTEEENIPMQEQIRVVIVDDHARVREGIKRILVAASDIVVIGEGANGADALQLAQEQRPDVMLLDMELPVLRGDQVAQIIRDTHLRVKILAVSSYDDRSYVQSMIENGALGYITKDEASELLVEAVRQVHAGKGAWMSPRVQK